MHEDRNTGPAETASGGSRQRWSTPTLTRIEAAAAEVSTRVQLDGDFTTS